jgi:hypothetical protein
MKIKVMSMRLNRNMKGLTFQYEPALKINDYRPESQEFKKSCRLNEYKRNLKSKGELIWWLWILFVPQFVLNLKFNISSSNGVLLIEQIPKE